MASTSNGYVVTDHTWRTCDDPEDGWEQLDFDDMSWKEAVVENFPVNVDCAHFNKKAKWIWNRDTKFDPVNRTGTMYFRLHL